LRIEKVTFFLGYIKGLTIGTRKMILTIFNLFKSK
jgi:hypothetical protein